MRMGLPYGTLSLKEEGEKDLSCNNTHTQNVAAYRPGRDLSLEHNHANTLSSDSTPPELGGINFSTLCHQVYTDLLVYL